ncbi:hypothetical protein HMPREF9469_02765 [ [[Clostridium] citroniae WAL-17108]|uniref:Uncharacterized protein n=1 Tax=[Clostridium] citroniae WAL-17108 TaxID=742733 RepID=G5HJL4_9FIRM|nr:hypothetical protein HMPREF9469_02765 [ [[Clostridium] citroniae WAL-17108]
MPVNHDTYRYLIAFPLLVLCLLASGFSDPFSIKAYGNPLSFQESSDSGLSGHYREYRRRFEAIETTAGIDDNGFEMIGPKVFDMEMEGIGQVFVTLTFDTEYDRLACFYFR